MKIYTLKSLPSEIENKAMSLMSKDNRLSFAAAVCNALTEKHGVLYGCYGGTAVMPIEEFRPIKK